MSADSRPLDRPLPEPLPADAHPDYVAEAFGSEPTPAELTALSLEALAARAWSDQDRQTFLSFFTDAELREMRFDAGIAPDEEA